MRCIAVPSKLAAQRRPAVSSSPRTTFPFQSITQQHLQASISSPTVPAPRPAVAARPVPLPPRASLVSNYTFPKSPPFFPTHNHTGPPLLLLQLPGDDAFRRHAFYLPDPSRARPPSPRPCTSASCAQGMIPRSVGFISSLSRNAAGHAFPVFGRKEVESVYKGGLLFCLA